MSSDPASGAALDDELIGQTVDGFRIEELIGSGGMGRVYKALDTRLERLVALKFLAKEASPEFQARFQREARAVSAIHHPHVAQIYSFGDYRGRSYFAMEYVHGGSLAAELGPGRRPTAQRCLSWMLEAACGLEAAYEQGLVHRDVKPSNLLLSGDGKIKLVDFGLVRRLEGDPSLTRTDTTVGTPRYIAPEQALGQPVDHRADIYALGASFYHLLAGQPPYEADTPMSLMLQHVQAPLPSLRARNPRVPAEVAALVERMMAKSPAGRPATYSELVADIRRLQARIERARVSAFPDGFPSVSRSSAPASAWLLPSALIAALLAIAVALLLRPSGSPPTAAVSASPEALPAGAATSELAAAAGEPGAGSGSRLPAGSLMPRLPLDPSRAIELALRARTASALHHLTVATEAFLAEHGQAPLNLEALVTFFDLDERDLNDGWREPLRYEPLGGEGYRITSAGPDRTLGTADDLVVENGRFLSDELDPAELLGRIQGP